MRILFFEPFCINIPHFGTCLELMIEHLKNGDEVSFLGCDAELSTCDVNARHDLSVCAQCQGRKYMGLNKITKYGKIDHYNLYRFISDSERSKLTNNYHFNDIDELKAFSFEDFKDIGYGVASSLISAMRDPFPDTVVHSSLINQFIFSSKLVYKSFDAALQEISPERVYLYNGRYSIIRPAFRACLKRGKDVFLHEAGSDLTKYQLSKNNLLHDVEHTQLLIKNFWEHSEETEIKKKEKADQFYISRRNGISKNWYSFTSDHVWELPSEWDKRKYNIVIFTSSEDEFAAVGNSWKNPVYENQHEAIKRISKDLQNEKDIQIWIRLHPNLKNVSEKLIKPYLEINFPFVHVIMPDSNFSTYLLMDNADKVITFGSTAGIEASYWGKISILLGMSFYKGMNCVYEANSHQEGIALILDRDIVPLDNIFTLKYGYYMDNFGIPYKYFKKTGIFTGVLDGWDFSLPVPKTPLLKKISNKLLNVIRK